MPSRPIAHHAATLRGNVPPILPFLAPRAFENLASANHIRRWMSVDIAFPGSAPCHGTPAATQMDGVDKGGKRATLQTGERIRVAPPSASSHLGRQTRYIEYGIARPQCSPKDIQAWPLPACVAPSGLSGSNLRSRCSGMRAIFHQFARRAYSTSEEDYLVEEDEEKAILAKSGEESRPETTQLMHLMNPDFRQLRRLEFLLKSSNTPPTADMDQLLQRANCFPPLDDFPQQDVWWIKKFARLNAVYDVRLPVELRSSQLEINALTEQIVKLLLHRGRDVDSIRCSWIADIRGNYSEEGKRNVWGEIMLWLLHHDHDAVLPALEATARGRKSPSYVIADILEQFMSNCLQNSEVGQSSLPSTLLPTLTILLERIPYLGRALSQKFFHLTLVHSTLEQGLELWSLLRENGFRPSWHTYYHLAYFFGRQGQYVKALEALKRPIELGAPPTHWAFLATCAQVLRSSATEAQAYHASSSILAEFIKMGVHLNVYLYTVIMHNAVDHGDVQTALNIFSLLREKGIEPNDYTYTVLLKGLKDGGNQDALRDVIREAGEALPKLSRPEVVATDILHCVYLNHFEPACSERTFIDLAQTYQEYFDPLPLIRLGVPARLFGKQRSLHRLNIPPPHQSIGIVLSAYLELVSRNEPEEVVRLYRIFRQRIDNLEDGYKLSSLRKNSYFYNAFLLALGQHPSTLQLMPELLRHMVDKRIHSAPLATEHTWDILVNAFMRHKQPEAADRVVQMISSYGQEPNEVTWNSLVRGYGRMQDIDKILDTIRQMQLRRIDLSDYSLRVLGMMKESDKLSQGLREMEDVRRRKVEEEMDYLVPEDYQEELAEGTDKEEGIQGESMNKEDVEGKWRDDECVLGALEKNHKDPIQNSR